MSASILQLVLSALPRSPLRLESMDCHCNQPGWCKTYKREMLGRLYEICSGKCPTERPCPHPDYIAMYKEQWAREADPTAKPKPDPVKLPCTHLGAPTGERRLCPSCNGHVEVKVLMCSVHGECTMARKAEGLVCCRVCGDYQEPPVSACLLSK